MPRPKLNVFTAALLALACAGPVMGSEVSVATRIDAGPDRTADELWVSLQRKARSLCRTHTIRPYARLALERECREEFMREAVHAIDREDLSALYVSETGGIKATVMAEAAGREH